MDRFSKFLFLHQLIGEKILYVYITKIFTLPAMLLIVLWKSKIQKNLTDFNSTLKQLLTFSDCVLRRSLRALNKFW